MSQPSDYILLGSISGIHGVKGWLKIFSHTSPRIKITEYNQWFLRKRNEDWKPIKVLGGKVQGKNIIALLDGVTDRNQVESLIGSEIAIESNQLEKLLDGEYYWKDLIGLSVLTEEGDELGKIDWLFNSGSNDVIVVKDKRSGEVKERMLPFLRDDVVLSIDMDKSEMIVNWDPDF